MRSSKLLLRGIIVNRTYGTHKNLCIHLFSLTIFGPILLWSPVFIKSFLIVLSASHPDDGSRRTTNEIITIIIITTTTTITITTTITTRIIITIRQNTNGVATTLVKASEKCFALFWI